MIQTAITGKDIVLERLSQLPSLVQNTSKASMQEVESDLHTLESELAQAKKAHDFLGNTTGGDVLQSLLQARKAFSVSFQHGVGEMISS